MKKFMMFSVACLCLALSCFLFTQSFYNDAQAQAGGTIEGFTAVVRSNGVTYLYVITPNGDVWISGTGGATFNGNFWGGAVNVQETTWGAVKDMYKGEDNNDDD